MIISFLELVNEKNDFEDFNINKKFLFIIILLLKMVLMLIEKLQIRYFN
jgi:hypothetical protein